MAAAFLFLPAILVAYPSVSHASAGAAETLDFSGPPGAKGLPSGWNLKVHRGTANAGLVSNDGEEVLHMRSVKSSFSLEHDVSVNTRTHPYLVWTWKAVTLPSKGDVRDSSKNDQALQLLVAFKDGRVISYVWDSNAPKGTVVDQSIPWPFSIKIKVVVVQSGSADLDKWVTNRRNIYEDYKRLFGKEPPRAERVRVQMNTQYTRSSAEGFVRDVRFSGKTFVAKSDIPGVRVVDSANQ